MLRYFFRREIEFRHAFIRAGRSERRGDEFAVFVVQDGLAADQVGPAFSAASVGSMAKTAIRAENLAATLQPRRGRQAASQGMPSGGLHEPEGCGRLGRSWTCLRGAGQLDGAETEGCSATKAAAPSPSNVKKTIFTRCKMASRLRLRLTFPLILSLSPLEANDLDRLASLGGLPGKKPQSLDSAQASRSTRDFRKQA